MVDAPVDCDSAVVHGRMAVMQLAEGGIATSGNYRNYKENPSGRVWHTISTTDGRPAHTDLLSATIDKVEALLVTLNPADSTLYISTTPGFPEIQK